MDSPRKPDWLRARLPGGPGFAAVNKLVGDHQLHTVCQSAQCPNLGECWSRGTATIMILGNICTRSCNFCAVQTGRPTELDLGEPARVAEAVARMNLRHCVLTSVAREELEALKHPGTANAIAFPGLSINGFTNSPNSGIVFVALKPFEERPTRALSGEPSCSQIRPMAECAWALRGSSCNASANWTRAPCGSPQRASSCPAIRLSQPHTK